MDPYNKHCDMDLCNKHCEMDPFNRHAALIYYPPEVRRRKRWALVQITLGKDVMKR